MEWMLHHVNVPAHDVRQTAAFLRDVIGLNEGRWTYPEQQGDLHHDNDGLAYFGIENRGLHVVRSIPTFARENGFLHNPTIGGHFAICVPDIEAVKRRLDAVDVPYTDAGVYAMAGIHQVYCYDPSFNLIEINQIETPLPAEAAAEQDPAADVALHHVAIPAHDVRQSAAFYGELIGLSEREQPTPGVALFEQDGHGVRIVKPSTTYARDHGMLHNPTLGGYFAITVPDIEAVKSRLEAADVVYTDAGPDPIDGARQIFVYCPSMRLIALHQAIN